MRTSLTARFVSRPAINFSTGRSASRRVRLGLATSSTVYHRTRSRWDDVRALRSLTSGYRFAPLPSLARVQIRRSPRSTGAPHSRRG